MRKAFIIGLPVLVVASLAAAWLTLRSGDPVAAAKQRMAQADMRGAELYLRKALHQQPNNPEVPFLLGRVDLALGNPEAAELELRRARDHGYDPRAIILPLGQAYLGQHHFDAVLRDFMPQQAPPGGQADTETIRAAAQLALGDIKGAEDTIAQAEAAAPKSRDTLLTAARIALAANDLNGASTRAAKVLAAEPNQPEALLLIAEIAIRHNDPKSALASARQILSTTPNRLDARMMEARALAALNQTAAARAAVQKVLRGTPKSAGANYLSAMLAIQAGDYPAADAALTTISTLVSELPRGFYFVAVTKLGMGQPAQAEEAATKFLTKSPDDPGGLKLMAFIDLARRHPERALALLQSGVLAAHPDSDTLDLQGRAQAMAGDMKAARTSFSEAAKLAPTDVQILNRLAAAELDLGQTKDAEAQLQQSLALSPKQRLAGEAIVQAALARGDIPAALADVERLRQAIGDAEEVGVLAAQVRIAALDLPAAEAQLRDVLRRFPDSRAAKLNLARIYGLRGDEAAAQDMLMSQLKRHPDDEAVLNVLLPSLFSSGHVEQAVSVAEAAHTAAPDSVGIIAALAGTYVRAHQSARAVALLDRASTLSSPVLDLLRARALVVDGKPDQAEEAFRAVLRQTPDDLRARSELAGLLVANKDYDGARAVLREGLEQSAGNAVLLGGLVGVELKQRGIQAAVALAATLRADPQNRPAADALAGDAWMTAGDARHASAAFLAAYKLAPNGDLATKAAGALAETGSGDQAISLLSAWVASHPGDIGAQAVLSSLYIKANRLADAAAHLDAVLSVRRTDVTALNNLAWIKQQQGDIAGARNLAERAYFQSPTPEVADTLGWILARQGETALALTMLSQAALHQSGAGQASAAYHYGWALNAAGRTDEAKEQLKAALASKADFPDRADAQALMNSLHG
jgi:putative PEP-CTERM system TPR-repeat lipoprotein